MLENMDEAECKAKFRVETNDLHRVPEAMQIPGTLILFYLRRNGGITYACY